MINDSIQNWRRYKAIFPAICTAFEWLTTVDESTLIDGKHLITDGMFALVQTYSTKSMIGSTFEAHEVYMDIQVVLRGQEVIFWANAFSKGDLTPYSVTDDIKFIAVEDPPAISSAILMDAMDFMILYPGEWHMPCIQTQPDAPVEVRKVVVKVHRDLLI